MKFGFGVQIWLRDNHLENFYRMLDEMALEGIDGVEIFYPFLHQWYGRSPGELRSLLDMHGLEISSYCSNVCYRDEALRKTTLEEAKARYRFAAEIGCKNVVTDEAYGSLPLGCSLSDHIKKVAEGTNSLGDFANSLGLTLSWHNHWGSTFETLEPYEMFVGLLDNDCCGLCIDVGQLKLGGINETEIVGKYAKKVKFMHYKDVSFKGRPSGRIYPGGPDVPENTGAYTVDAKGRWVELGRGDVDFIGVTKALLAVGYDGWIVDDLDSTSYSARESLAACKDYLNNGLGIWTERDYKTGKKTRAASVG